MVDFLEEDTFPVTVTIGIKGYVEFPALSRALPSLEPAAHRQLLSSAA